MSKCQGEPSCGIAGKNPGAERFSPPRVVGASGLVFARTEAEDHREHDATAGRTEIASAPEGGVCVRFALNGIRVRCTVGGDGIGCDRSGDAVARDLVLVEDVVEAETEFSVVEPRVAANGVVEEEVGEGEGRDRRLIMEGTVVQALGSDGLVEDTYIPGAALVGKAFRKDVGGSVGDPEAARRGDIERRRGRACSLPRKGCSR